jgi:hypothetical protein
VRALFTEAARFQSWLAMEGAEAEPGIILDAAGQREPIP